jgi:hypothetical protein
MAWRGPTTKPVANKPPHNPINHGHEMAESKKPVVEAAYGPNHKPNRAYDLRRDTDTQKNFSVTLIDIDTAILTHLDTVISPTIIDAGRQIKVPINYASPEKWKSIQQDGVIRDHNGKIQTPVIAFRRSTMQRNDNLITLNRYLQYPAVKHFSEKNKYDRFSAMSGFMPVKEIYSVAMPDHVIINYEFIIWTELIEQGNAVVEAINFATEDYWGDKNRFKFRTSISDYNFETTNDAGQDRIVRSTFSMMVNAYLLPDKFENYKSVVQKAFTPRKVVFDVHEKIVGTIGQSGERTSVSVNDGNLADSNQPPISQNINYNIVNQNSTLEVLNIVGGGDGGATGSFTANSVTISGSADIDSQLIGDGNAARWLVSISNGSDIKVNEVMSSWNNVSSSFYVTEVSQIGYVPVSLSVNNVGGSIHLLATPLSGTWTLKYIKMVV